MTQTSGQLVDDTLKHKPPSASEKTAYGLGGGGDSIMANLIFSLAYPIYQAGLGIDARLIGLAVGVPRLWDAIVDPLIGNISDNSRLKWGRRKPFIFIGAVLTGLMCMLMWMPPVNMNKTVIFAYFFVCSILYFTSFALFTIPYNALGYEMSLDYDERTSVMSYKFFFMCLIASLTLPLAFRMCFWFGPNKVAGVKVVGVVFGLVMIIFGVLPAFLCRERMCNQTKIAAFSAFKYSLKNKPFLIACGIIFFMILGVYISQPLQYYINMAYILPGNEIETSKYIMYHSYIWGIMGFASVPVINFFSRRYGKKIVLQLGLVLIMTGLMFSWLYYTPKRPYLQLLNSIIVSPGMTCIWVIIGSFIADICDLDELSTYRRREGMFGAVYNMALKGGVAFTMVVSGYVINWTGYQSASHMQSYQTVLKIRLMMAFIPTIFLGFAFVLSLIYPLSKQRVIKIRKELDNRKMRNVNENMAEQNILENQK
jgi:GPH family glycoside/pentoside/hexuronide:cation symporter